VEIAVLLAVVAFIGVVLLVILYLSVRVVQQYEKMLVFRLGKTNEQMVREPGLRFLVPIIDLGASVRAVELAARLNQGHKAEMVIVYVHEIPLQAPLAMPEKDPRIQRALDAAAFIAMQHAIEPRTKVNVARQAGHRIVEIAREEGVDLIVMGISHVNRPNEGTLGRIAEHVMRNAPCEVVVDRVPRQKVSLIPTEGG